MRQLRATLAGVVSVALILAACSKPAAGPAPEPDKTPAPITETTTIRVAYRRGTHTMITGEIDAFQERFPQYRIEPLSFLEEDPLDLLREQRADVILPVTMRPRLEEAAAELLLDLEPYLRGSQLDQTVFGDLLGATQFEGRQVALPYILWVYGLMYDKRALYQAGLTQPEAPQNWAKFRSVLPEITAVVDGVRVPGFRCGWANEYLVTNYLESKYGHLVYAPTEADLREALQFFQTLIFDDKTLAVSAPIDFLTPGHPYLNESDAPTGFMPFTCGGAADMSAHPVFPIPSYATDTRPIIHVRPELIGIAANSPVPEAAWAFVEFLIGEDGASVAARKGRVPAYRTDVVRQAWEQRPARLPEVDRLWDAVWIAPTGPDEQRLALNMHTLAAAHRVFSGAMTVEESIAQWRLDTTGIGP